MDFDILTERLLADWCEALLRHQIVDPDDPIRDGALGCPSCDRLHGRCWEAVYPLLNRAKATGDARFLTAAVRLVEWSANVTRSNGAWSNDLDPTSWQGTTIFGAIALAEAIHHHGDLLSDAQMAQWKVRLDRAASGYLWTDFVSLDFTNINYGFSAVYGFDLIGRVLGQQRFVERSRELAAQIKGFLTSPNALIFGEGKPADNRSGRGLLPVDLGYNVEESLNGVVLYALEKKDESLLDLLETSMRSHLEFMLPDGAWDNSWGTRQFKWTYWGSRTSDGCQPAFAMMAGRDPVFGAAAFRNTQLLEACTHDGLLHGGPHYVSHGVKPCIHHTFAHAKALAFVQDNKATLPKIDGSIVLPREASSGVRYFPELAVWLAARGPWRATVSAYDSIYWKREEPEALILQATGGSLALLHHEFVGTIFAASMAKYLEVEPRNQQPNPGPDFSLTPRVETVVDGVWYTNLYDLQAAVAYDDDGETTEFHVSTTMQDATQTPAGEHLGRLEVQYAFDEETTTVTVARPGFGTTAAESVLVLPVISPSGEEVRVVSARRIEIVKPHGTVIVEADADLAITDGAAGRVFNMVPGCEAIPITIPLPIGGDWSVSCRISVIA